MHSGGASFSLQRPALAGVSACAHRLKPMLQAKARATNRKHKYEANF
jgi:hypothetical protein